MLSFSTSRYVAALVVLGVVVGCGGASEGTTPSESAASSPDTLSLSEASPLAAFATSASWLSTSEGFVVHWSIESVDDDQAIGLARITSHFGESVIDEDVRVVLTASESGSGTITFGTADPRPAEWTDDQLTVVNAEIDDRIYTPATLDEAATARRVLLDAAKIARDEAAATTTLPPTTYQLIGVVTLDSSSIEGAWDTCRGTGGYGDFGAGMNVAVRDDVGAIVANTSTRHFAEDEFFEDPMADQVMSLELNLAKRGGATAGTCTVLFALDVPEVEFYEVQVGRRGSLVYSFDDLDDQNWRLHLSLGS